MSTPPTDNTLVVLYDGSLGGTPDTQGKLSYRAASLSPSALDSMARLNPAIAPSSRALSAPGSVIVVVSLIWSGHPRKV